MILRANIVDLNQRQIFPGEIHVHNGRIQKIDKVEGTFHDYIMPGFIDAHVHIESSMLVPSEFAKLAVQHGTVATVSDPHEIANVLGARGVHFMIDNGKTVPLKFNFGAPSCVPATSFETAGDTLDSDDVRELLKLPDIRYLAEMMNYPGVIYEDEEVLAKIKAAHDLGLPVDGHAPGLRGDDLAKYIAAGITTDHECFTLEEALEKRQHNMKIIIRQGSAAKNYTPLIPLMTDHSDDLMFCSDDKHPDDLVVGHINQLAARAVADGYPVFDVLKAACLNPIKHYNLDVGDLTPGAKADFIRVRDLEHFETVETFIDGVCVYRNGQVQFSTEPPQPINRFSTSLKSPEQFRLALSGNKARVIRALDGELITETMEANVVSESNDVVTSVDRDILKIAVVNRYSDEEPAVALITGFGMTSGALASCVAHDSHNIIAVGMDNQSICRAVNLIIENKGGISVVDADESNVLPLPIAGIMSNRDGQHVAREYARLDKKVKQMGSRLSAPFMTLSFMALLVIPQLKLSDKGLFDGQTFRFVDINLD